MGLFTWRDEYSVDHSQIDGQHRGLFHLADELHEAMMHGAGREVISKTLSQLVEYTCKHFRDEEMVMRVNAYPLYTEHKAEHDKLTAQVLELKRGLESGNITITMDTMHFLREWLEKHIMQLDRQIAAHVAARTGRADLVGAAARR